MLIITGCGKSGTMFASRLFYVAHEPRARDFQVLSDCFYDKQASKEYISEVFKGDERESNSLLAVHVRAIKELYPKATIIHLVRHPLDTIPSLVSGGLYNPESQVKRNRIRLAVEGWKDKGVFERCCYWWVEVNRMVRETGVPVLRLEDLAGEPTNQGTHMIARSTLSEEQTEQCREICGKEASYYNYKI